MYLDLRFLKSKYKTREARRIIGWHINKLLYKCAVVHVVECDQSQLYQTHCGHNNGSDTSQALLNANEQTLKANALAFL